MAERNVQGGELEPCGTDPLTGFYRDGCCHTGPDDLGSHTVCAVVTAEFLANRRRIGNALSTPMPQYHFPGLVPGDRWCVTAINWLRAHRDGAAAPVVLASTHERALEIVPLEALREHAVDVPADPSALTGGSSDTQAQRRLPGGRGGPPKKLRPPEGAPAGRRHARDGGRRRGCPPPRNPRRPPTPRS